MNTRHLQSKRTTLRTVIGRLWAAVLGKNAELLLATCSILWGGWLVCPPYDTFSRSLTYRAMSELAPEHVWGGVMMIVGLCKLFGIGLASERLRRLGLFLAMSLWVFQGIMFYAANSSTPGTAVYILFGVANAVCFVLEWRQA